MHTVSQAGIRMVGVYLSEQTPTCVRGHRTEHQTKDYAIRYHKPVPHGLITGGVGARVSSTPEGIGSARGLERKC